MYTYVPSLIFMEHSNRLYLTQATLVALLEHVLCKGYIIRNKLLFSYHYYSLYYAPQMRLRGQPDLL